MIKEYLTAIFAVIVLIYCGFMIMIAPHKKKCFRILLCILGSVMIILGVVLTIVINIMLK